MHMHFKYDKNIHFVFGDFVDTDGRNVEFEEGRNKQSVKGRLKHSIEFWKIHQKLMIL